MSRLAFASIFVSVALISFASTRNQVQVSDPIAVAYAAQSIVALTGGTTITDISMTGNVTWMPGSDDNETGTVT